MICSYAKNPVASTHWWTHPYRPSLKTLQVKGPMLLWSKYVSSGTRMVDRSWNVPGSQPSGGISWSRGLLGGVVGAGRGIVNIFVVCKLMEKNNNGNLVLLLSN